MDDAGRVREIQVKRADASSNWIWGAFRMSGAILAELHRLWLLRDRGDEYIGTLVNAWLAEGGEALGVTAGHAYVDVGTLHGYREAIQLLSRRPARESEVAIVPHIERARTGANDDITLGG
jgi:hypothetical protein